LAYSSGANFATLYVTGVYSSVVLPLLQQIIQRKECRDRADRHAGPTIDALYGIDVELRNLIEARTGVVVPRVLLRVMLSTGRASTLAVSLVPMQGSARTYAMGQLPLMLFCSFTLRLRRDEIQSVARHLSFHRPPFSTVPNTTTTPKVGRFLWQHRRIKRRQVNPTIETSRVERCCQHESSCSNLRCATGNGPVAPHFLEFSSLCSPA
jgi:hypothetical protein